MTKVTLITNSGRKSTIVSEDTTLRQIYEQNGVNYEASTNMVDSVPLQIGDLDRSLRELGVGENVRLSSIVKMNNAAKILVAGDVAVIKSGVKLEDWKKIAKYNSTLGLEDEDGEMIFAVGVSKGTGSVSANGIEFSSSPDAEGFATVTAMCVTGTADEKKEKIANELGEIILNLNEIEQQVPDLLEAAKANDATVSAAIQLL